MRKLLTLSFLMGAVVLAGACDDDDDNGGGPNPTMATVRVIHSSPDAPNMDIVVDGTEIISDLAYSEASSYIQVEAGQRNIEGFEAGTTTLLFDFQPTLAGDTPYTIVASDIVANVTPVLLTDDNTATGADEVRVRAIHASPSTGPVDVYVTGPTDPLGAPAITNIAFGATSDYLEVPAGTYRVRVTPTGTSTVVLDETYPLVEGQVRTIVAQDGLGVDPVELVVYADAGPATSLAAARVLHVSPDATALDIDIDGSLLADDLDYEFSTDYFPVASGTRGFIATPGAGGAAVIDEGLDFAAGTEYTVLVADSLANIGTIVLTDNNAAPTAGNIKLRIVHGAAAGVPVDVYVTDAAVVDLTGLTADVEGVVLGGFTAYMDMAAGMYRIWVTAAGDQATVLANEAFDFSAAGPSGRSWPPMTTPPTS